MDEDFVLSETMVDEPAWHDYALEKLAETAIKAVLSHLSLPTTGYMIAVLGCDDDKILNLNSDFRGKAKATNVLSWPAEAWATDSPPPPGDEGDPTELGDIAIAFQTCQSEANDQGKTLHDHATHLLVHAILHLFGYDHEEDDEATLMEAEETAILAVLGIADPYS